MVGPAAGAEDLIGGVENPLGRALGNRLSMVPRLDIAAAVFSACKIQRLTAQKCHGLGLDFADITRPYLRFGGVLIVAMSQHDVAELVEERFMW